MLNGFKACSVQCGMLLFHEQCAYNTFSQLLKDNSTIYLMYFVCFLIYMMHKSVIK